MQTRATGTRQPGTTDGGAPQEAAAGAGGRGGPRRAEARYMQEGAMTNHSGLPAVAALVVVLFFAGRDAAGQPVQCRSEGGQVAAITNPSGHYVTTRFQLDDPNLQTLLTTRVRTTRGCLVAHLSGMVRITDNYVAFQVRVDGVPMHGQVVRPGLPPDPVVLVLIDSASPPYDDEQYIDPVKVVSYNLFLEVGAGVHTVEVMAAGGSNIDPANPPSATSLVLTLQHP